MKWLLPGMLAVALAAPACADDQPDVAAGEQAASGLSAGLDLAAVSRRFDAPSVLSTTTIDLAPGVTTREIERAAIAATSPASCLTVDTDSLTYIELSFDDCRVGFLGALHVTGSLRAAIGFETGPCTLGDCPTALLSTVSTPGLTIDGPAGYHLGATGSWTLRDPLAVGAPTESTSDVSLDTARGTATMTSNASFTYDDAGCLALSAEAQVDVPDREDLGQIAVRADGIQRCPGACPTTGDVTMSFDGGKLLAWSYSGDGAVDAVGPRGQTLSFALPCAD